MTNLRSKSSLIKKYKFEEYSSEYPILYRKEKQRILSKFQKVHCKVHHFGSTAIKNVGGKGVIDIYIEAAKSDIKQISNMLIEQLGYEFRSTGGNKERLFHQIEISGRRYHLHLAEYGNKDLQQCLKFRDFLNKHQDLAAEYSNIKRKAACLAQKQKSKNEMKQIYMQTKQPIIDKVVALMNLESN